MRLVLLLLVAVELCLAQNARSLRVAETAFIGAASADIVSSWQTYELNPVLGRGQFGTRQAILSAGISVGAVVLFEAMHHRWPQSHKTLTTVMWIMCGVRGTVAAKNWRQR